jgi:hypothetical protein
MDPANEAQLNRCHCAELCKQVHCDAEHFDRLLLILSSVLLAANFLLTRDFGGPQPPAMPGLLLTAWILFAVTILLTFISFRLGQCAIRCHMEHAGQCCTDPKEGATIRPNTPAMARCWVHCLLATTFLVAVVLWLVFATVNVL